MQNLKYPNIPTTIQIPQYIKIGYLIGRQGRNLRPIAGRTGTSIHVNTNTNPAQIEIKLINNHRNASPLPSFENRIDEAKDQLNDLIKNLEKRRNQTKEKKEKSVRNLDDKKFDSDRYAALRRQKEISLRKERIVSNREKAFIELNDKFIMRNKRDERNARKNIP